MSNPIELLFSTEGFPARWHCGVWTALHGWIHIGSDLAIFFAYLAIPLVLSRFVLRRKDVPFPSVFWLFSAFIVLCGLTHLLEALMFWVPVYRLAGVVKVATAAVSWATVGALIPIVPKALGLRSVETLEQQIEARTRELTAKKLEAERLAQIVAHSDDAIVSVGRDGRITSWNAGACQLYGRTEAQMLGQPFEGLVPEGQLGIHRSRVDAALQGERAPTLETERLRPVGGASEVSTRIQTLRDADGAVQGWSEIGRDISDKRQAETRFQLAVEAAPNGMIMVDRAGTITLVNRQTEALFGYPRQELIGKSVSALVPEPSRHRHQGFVDAFFGDPQTRKMGGGRELFGRRKDGGMVPVEIGLNPIHTDHGVYTLASIIDITERKAWIEQLTQAEARLNTILDSMPSTLIAVDATGKVTHWNQPASALTDLLADDALGKDVRDLLPQLGEVLAHLDGALQAREVFQAEKIRVITHGEARLFDVSIFPLGADGPLGAAIRVDDTTDRSRLEEIMVQSEKMLSVGGLAAGMAHEINNPLSAILQGSQNLRRRLAPDLPKNQRVAAELGVDFEHLQAYLGQREVLRFIDDIQDAGQRAARIVRDMLAFSRGSTVEIVPSDPHALIDTTLRLAETDYVLNKPYDFRKVTIVRRFDPSLTSAPLDPTGFQQVLLNLFKNAAFAMASAGVEEPRLEITTRIDGRWIRIDVKDNGPGMPEEVRRRVFEPFYTTKGVGVGTGLGLSVSYFIISRHGGTMAVESAPGRGCRFILRLPLERGDAAAGGE